MKELIFKGKQLRYETLRKLIAKIIIKIKLAIRANTVLGW